MRVQDEPLFRELGPGMQHFLVNLENRFGPPPPTFPDGLPSWKEFHSSLRRYGKELAATETGRLAREEREKRRAELRRTSRPCYLRFREPPPDGKSSRNYYPGAAPEEGGLCCFHAWETADGKYIIDPGNLELAMTALIFQTAGWREPVFVVEGEEVGVGSGGEPLLANYEVRRIPRDAVSSLWEFGFGGKVSAWLSGFA